jgi:hypothetical protein
VTAELCPGPLVCYGLGGSQPCRLHGCRVCGSCILADTEDWPAPLCIVHAPEPLLDATIALRVELERVLGYFDGAHEPDCVVWRLLGRAATDYELAQRMKQDGRSFCSCGYFAIREGARLRFGLAGDKKHDTEREPAALVGRLLS